jgi:hypothetical protein
MKEFFLLKAESLDLTVQIYRQLSRFLSSIAGTGFGAMTSFPQKETGWDEIA